jgi:hypothetical protein
VLAESRSEKTRARPANLPPAVSEGAGPARKNEQLTIAVSEAGKRNAYSI